MRKTVLIPILAAMLILASCSCRPEEKEKTPPATDSPKTETAAPEESYAPLPEVSLLLATFNIKHCDSGVEKIAEVIKTLGPDIIGLEEVDKGAERSGGEDQPKLLAELAGYPYYRFCKAIDLQGGEYGTAILSRYPIEFFEAVPLYSGNGEPRSYGHAVIKVKDTPVDVFVTHLSYEDRTVRAQQMDVLAKILACCRRYVLLGDLNSFNLPDIERLKGEYYVNRPDRLYPTFRNLTSAPDNIVVSKGFTETDSGTVIESFSDHKVLYAAMLMKP